MTIARASVLSLLLPLLIWSCGDRDPRSADAPTPSMRAHPSVVQGADAPEALGIDINRFERNAVLGQLARSGGKTSQGCSATLVGDRVVVTAGHCVVMNQDAWIKGKEKPQVAPASQLSYAAGDDVNAPLWRAKAKSIHLHPDIQVIQQDFKIRHDLAVVILQDSAWSSGASIVPLQMNREPLESHLVGQDALQGGFGSTDGTYDFSPKRFWSRVQIDSIGEHHVTVRDIQKGFPTYGDSGSGLLIRFPDGSLRTLGMASSGTEGKMDVARMDVQIPFVDTLMTPELLCGPIDAKGVCRDDVLVRCDANGFSSIDCRVKQTTCGTDASGQASCQCTCDEDATCTAGCACDANCPCTCDRTPGCDQGCACDARCAVPEPASPPSDCAIATPVAKEAPSLTLVLGLALSLAALLGRRRG